jgi:hypothetical protein
MKGFLFALSVFLCAAGIYANELDLGLQAGASTGTVTPSPLWLKGLAGFDASSGRLEVLGHLGFRTDGTYGGFMNGGYGYGNLCFQTIDGGFIYSGDSIKASMGKLEMRDIVDSPYSLFLSGRNNKALTASLDFNTGNFFYQDRWISLSYNLLNTYEGATWSWPDRSAVVKAWGVQLGSFRVALQDAIVYTGSSGRDPLFNYEYYLYPIPSFFVQYIGSSEDSPWRQNDYNDNSMTGFMLDWRNEDWYALGQVLVDDFDTNRFLKPSGTQNPDKIAWEMGVTRKTEIGTFGFYHAGATKYTFEPYGNSTQNDMYGYTFSPDVEFDVNGKYRMIEPEDNYVGYLHGENNIAFMGTWKNLFDRCAVEASLEFMISGSKSPANPWGPLMSWSDDGSGDKLLNDARLEKRLVLSGSASIPAGSFVIGAEVKIGWVWNELDLASTSTSASDAVNGLSYYYPSNKAAPIGQLAIGATYHLPF